jgi:hypothetical protein
MLLLTSEPAHQPVVHNVVDMSLGERVLATTNDLVSKCLSAANGTSENQNSIYNAITDVVITICAYLGAKDEEWWSNCGSVWPEKQGLKIGGTTTVHQVNRYFARQSNHNT